MAFAEVQLSAAAVATLVAPLTGVTAIGVVGGATIVVNDHTGPATVPAAFRAVICQKYVVPGAIPAGTYDAAVIPLATGAGGFVVPKLTS